MDSKKGKKRKNVAVIAHSKESLGDKSSNKDISSESDECYEPNKSLKTDLFKEIANATVKTINASNKKFTKSHAVSTSTKPAKGSGDNDGCTNWSNTSELEISNEFQNHVAKKLSALLDEEIEVTKKNEKKFSDDEADCGVYIFTSSEFPTTDTLSTKDLPQKKRHYASSSDDEEKLEAISTIASCINYEVKTKRKK